MKVNRIAKLLSISIMFMLFTACDPPGSSTRMSQNVSYDSKGFNGLSAAAPELYDGIISEDFEENSSGEFVQDAKLIYTGNVSMESVNFDDVLSTVKHFVNESQGYFQNEDIYTRNSYVDSRTYREANLVIRVPVENFKSLMSSLESLEANSQAVITRSNVSTEDVSETYYDLETRLGVAKDRVEQLRSLLKQSDTVSDTIAVQNALSDAMYDLEYLQGRINSYDSKIRYSYLNISLKEVTALTMTAKAVGYGNKLVESLKNGLFNGIEFFGELLLFIAGNWLILIVIGAVCFLVGRFIGRFRAKLK